VAQEDDMATTHPAEAIDIRSTAAAAPRAPGTAMLDIGVAVEVRSRFDQRWTHGFSIAEVGRADSGDDTYLLRRLSDGSVLPAWFPADMLRADRHS
jgi:hypothetical protein